MVDCTDVFKCNRELWFKAFSFASVFWIYSRIVLTYRVVLSLQGLLDYEVDSDEEWEEEEPGESLSHSEGVSFIGGWKKNYFNYFLIFSVQYYSLKSNSICLYPGIYTSDVVVIVANQHPTSQLSSSCWFPYLSIHHKNCNFERPPWNWPDPHHFIE